MTNQEAIEKFEKIKRGNIFLIHQRWEGKEIIEDYSLCDMAISALEKQIPKKTVKPESPYFRYACPSCGNYPLSGYYCGECGQAIVYDKEDE